MHLLRRFRLHLKIFERDPNNKIYIINHVSLLLDNNVSRYPAFKRIHNNLLGNSQKLAVLKNLSISNFRSIKSLEIPKLGHLNIVTGRNGCGKSSVLEAIFLNASAGNASALVTAAAIRGDAFIAPNEDSTFRSFFHKLDTSNPIQISTEEGVRHSSYSRVYRIEAVLSTEYQPQKIDIERPIKELRASLETKNKNTLVRFDF